ncbi:hypothetical protein HFD88_007849 [Aspergillus terreus]|nr:hypothetical protein HFD88_007849 [Aspergillus terreus]
MKTTTSAGEEFADGFVKNQLHDQNSHVKRDTMADMISPWSSISRLRLKELDQLSNWCAVQGPHGVDYAEAVPCIPALSSL